MTSRQVKRRADEQNNTDVETPTHTQKKPRANRSSSTVTNRRTRRSDGLPTPPVFDIQDSPAENMASNETHRSPKPPTAEEFKAMLRDGLANVAKKEQLDIMMTHIKRNASSLVSLEKKVESTNESNERRFEMIESRLDMGTRVPDHRQAAFDKARRSLRAWPIHGEDKDELDAAFRDFAVEALLIPDTAVRATAYSDIIRVRSSPQNSVYMEVIVKFKDPMERDFYYSKARNLAEYRTEEGSPTAGLRLDIPPYLMPTFKLLNDHGHDIRRAHGPETKRYIKYDDANLSLFLEVRLPGQVKWTRIKPEQARSFCDEKDRASYQIIRRGLMRPASEDMRNSNLVPLGQRSASTSGAQGSSASAAHVQSGGSATNAVPTIDGRRPRWIPPARDGKKPPSTQNV